MKQMKILGVLGIALTLGLTACTKSGGDSGKSQTAPSSEKHTHTAAEGAQWQMNDTQHWKDCKDNDGGKVDAGSHKWVKDESKTDVAATCQAEGKAYEKCSVCGKTRERTLSKAAHTYEQVDGADKVTWTKEANCEEGGVGTKECTVCHEKADVTTDPLGHTYPQDETGADIVTWTKEVTCEEGGEGFKTCSRCQHVEEVKVDPLGHKFELVGDDTEPEEGKAKVRVYTCANGCGQTSLGFKANEVSEESKKHLSFAAANEKGEIGASFWGRPIGNSLALDENGTSVAQQVDECVYCSTETGDFFEYVFDLTEDQIKSGLDNCRLWLDAKPADHMNGGDFFAYVGGNTDDWTPGFYIDGSEDHIEKNAEGQTVMVKDHAKLESKVDVNKEGEELDKEVPMGKRITDYRYILYVDDKVQTLEANVSNPTHGQSTNMRREEFCLPFVFKLHAGENKIRLCMAGGYRSTFYNFTFRPIVEDAGGDEVHVHEYSDTKAGSIDTEGCTSIDVFNCKDGDASAIRWEAKNYDATSNEIEAAAGDGSIRFNRAQGKNGEDDKGGHLVYKINSPVASKDVELAFYIQAHSQNVAIFDAVGNDTGVGKDVDAEGKFTVTPTKRYALYVNNERIELGEDPGASKAKAWFTFPAKFDLQEGENTIEIVSLGGYRAKIYNFQIQGLPRVYVPFAVFDAAAIKAGLSNNGSTASTGHYVEGGEETFTVYKIGTQGDKLTLTYTAAAAQKATLQLYMTTKNSNTDKAGVWFQGDSAKTKVTLNGTEVPGPEKADDKNLQQWGCSVRSPDAKDGSSALACPVWVSLIELDLVAGENTIVVEYLGGGYSYWFGGAQLAA